MPSGPPELREEFGDAADAISFLEKRGYVLTREFRWRAPSPEREPTAKELRAICYLVLEWDFGGLIGRHDETNANRYLGEIMTDFYENRLPENEKKDRPT